MRWLAATISLKVSAILPSIPRWSPVIRTEKSPDAHRLQRVQQILHRIGFAVGSWFALGGAAKRR